jgi:hypothetical protein
MQPQSSLDGAIAREEIGAPSVANHSLRWKRSVRPCAGIWGKAAKRPFAAILVALVLNAPSFASLASWVPNRVPSVSTPKSAGPIAHQKRKRARRNHCPCGIETERPPRLYDNSTVVKVAVNIDERGKVTEATALNGRNGLQERAEAEALKMGSSR